MPSERVQRRIDRLLDEAEEAADRGDWDAVRISADRVISVDPDNEDALSFLTMASGTEQVTATSDVSRPAGEANVGDNSVGADSDPPEGGPLPAPTTVSGRPLPPSLTGRSGFRRRSG